MFLWLFVYFFSLLCENCFFVIFILGSFCMSCCFRLCPCHNFCNIHWKMCHCFCFTFLVVREGLPLIVFAPSLSILFQCGLHFLTLLSVLVVYINILDLFGFGLSLFCESEIIGFVVIVSKFDISMLVDFMWCSVFVVVFILILTPFSYIESVEFWNI